MVGGPSPYHDSVTVSFFSTVAMDEALRTIFIEEAGKLALSIGETKEAEPCASPNRGPLRGSR
jgi:hypothetical protein